MNDTYAFEDPRIPDEDWKNYFGDSWEYRKYKLQCMWWFGQYCGVEYCPDDSEDCGYIYNCHNEACGNSTCHVEYKDDAQVIQVRACTENELSDKIYMSNDWTYNVDYEEYKEWYGYNSYQDDQDMDMDMDTEECSEQGYTCDWDYCPDDSVDCYYINWCYNEACDGNTTCYVEYYDDYWNYYTRNCTDAEKELYLVMDDQYDYEDDDWWYDDEDDWWYDDEDWNYDDDMWYDDVADDWWYDGKSNEGLSSDEIAGRIGENAGFSIDSVDTLVDVALDMSSAQISERLDSVLGEDSQLGNAVEEILNDEGVNSALTDVLDAVLPDLHDFFSSFYDGRGMGMNAESP